MHSLTAKDIIILYLWKKEGASIGVEKIHMSFNLYIALKCALVHYECHIKQLQSLLLMDLSVRVKRIIL